DSDGAGDLGDSGAGHGCVRRTAQNVDLDRNQRATDHAEGDVAPEAGGARSTGRFVTVGAGRHGQHAESKGGATAERTAAARRAVRLAVIAVDREAAAA